MCHAGPVTALMGIATRLGLARLYVVTGQRPPEELAALAEAVGEGGADVVGLEDAALDAREAAASLAVLRRAGLRAQPLVAFHGWEAVGALARPDALVLATDRTRASRARSEVGEHTVIGRRCNSAAEVAAALADPLGDFLLVGPGLDHVRHAAAVAPAHDPASKPWFAFGGITADSLGAVLRAGAMRVVVGRGVVAASDPGAAARALKDRLRAAWADDPRMEAVTLAAFGPQAHLTLGPAGDPPADDLHI